MAILRLVTVTLAALNTAVAAPSPEVQSTSAAAKYCDAATTICYSEYTSPAKVVYRIAIPDTATATAHFDVLLSIVAPTTVGWAAIAWGGQMANNPLTIGWANGASTVVSSRRAT